MDIRQIARPFEWEGATLWYLPYRHYLSDYAIDGLEKITPQMEYVNTKTGETTHETPKDLERVREKLRKLKVPASELKSDWQTRRLWDELHDLFWLVLPAIVAVDMPDEPSGILSAFYAFYSTQSHDVPTRWRDFNTVMGAHMFNALWQGYNATRENPAPASAEMAQAVEPADPKGEPSGEVPETTTSDS